MTPPLANPQSPPPSTFLSRYRQTRARLRELRKSPTGAVRDQAVGQPAGPKVSVMVITYNHERYIAQALESILEQVRDFDIEINVIDDASTDRTQDVVRAFQARHPDIVNCYFNTVNVGRVATQLNTIRGFRTLRGEYFALLEGDDYWSDPEKLRKQVAFLGENPEYVACAHQTMKIYDDGSRAPEHFLPFKEFSRNRVSIESLIRMDGVFHLSSIVYRNIFGLRPPLAFADPYSCEVTINMTYGLFGDFYCLPEYMSVYRVHGGGLFSTKSQEKIWMYHLGGFRRFAMYLGPAHWATFASTVVSFSRFVLLSPKRGIVPSLSLSARCTAWLHMAVAVCFFGALAPLQLIRKAARKFRSSATRSRGIAEIVSLQLMSTYMGIIRVLPDGVVHAMLNLEARWFPELQSRRRRLKSHFLDAISRWETGDPAQGSPEGGKKSTTQSNKQVGRNQ